MATFRGPFCFVQVKVSDDDGRQLMLKSSPLNSHNALPRGRHEYGMTFADIAQRIIQIHANTTGQLTLTGINITAVDARIDDNGEHNVTLTITCRARTLRPSAQAVLLTGDASTTNRKRDAIDYSKGPLHQPEPAPLMTANDVLLRRAQSGPLIGVGVLVSHPRHSGCVLLGRRRGSHGAGEYALPGGHLDYGESIESCAIREVMEETALQLDATAVQVVAVTQTVYNDVHKHYVTLFVRCLASGNDNAINVEADKCDGWEWAKWKDVVAGKYSPLFDPLRQLTEKKTVFIH